jgi:hypothetical protein
VEREIEFLIALSLWCGFIVCMSACDIRKVSRGNGGLGAPETVEQDAVA